MNDQKDVVFSYHQSDLINNKIFLECGGVRSEVNGLFRSAAKQEQRSNVLGIVDEGCKSSGLSPVKEGKRQILCLSADDFISMSQEVVFVMSMNVS